MDLMRLFKPKRIAVIGVSSKNPLHPANVVYSKNLHESKARVYGVNPEGGKNANNGDTIYRQLGDIGDDIDLAVIARRASHVPDILNECGNLKVGGAIVISGGFAEAGNFELQQKLVEVAKKQCLPVIGPNCLGIYSPPYVDTIFLSSERLIKPPRGKIAIVSQSGGIMVDQGMCKLAEESTGVSACVSLGNKAVVDEVHLLEHFEKDRRTNATIFYIEGFSQGRGREFVERSQKAIKPVVVYKAGRTELAKKAVSSHTASLSGNYRFASSVFKQHGIIEAKNEVDIVALAKLFTCTNKKIKRGDIAILTVSGGHGVIATDFIVEYELSLASLSEEEKQDLRARLNPSIHQIASLENPLDLTGSSWDSDYEIALEFLLAKKEVEAVLLLILPYQESISLDIGAKLGSVAKRHEKPVIAYMPWHRKYNKISRDFQKSRIPVGHSVEESVKMVKGLKR